MKPGESELDLIRQAVANFYETFYNRPRMLGTAENAHAMLYFVDQIDFILTFGEPLARCEYTWNRFLHQRGYIKGARSLLDEALRNDENNFELLHRLRREYKD